ncbi:hypothetical protein AAVH_28483 [Aphelenchoides avenae]|nr:hypothetical protein AAVH_28483 [Aphelenchus avenae]
MGGGNPSTVDAMAATKRTPQKRIIVDNSEDEYFSVSSQASLAETSKRPRLTTDHGYDSLEDSDADEAADEANQDGYDSFDDEEENRRMDELCAASLATENAKLKVQVGELRAEVELTTMQREFWRSAADDHQQAFRLEQRERVHLEQEGSDQDRTIALLRANLVDERRKNQELTRQLQHSCVASGITGICKCLFSPSGSADFDPSGTIYRRIQPPLGCHRYELLNLNELN